MLLRRVGTVQERRRLRGGGRYPPHNQTGGLHTAGQPLPPAWAGSAEPAHAGGGDRAEAALLRQGARVQRIHRLHPRGPV